MPKVSPWKQRSDGLWSRPLIGPERMFDQWLEIDGWTEWMGAVIFTIAPCYASQINSKAHVETWFSKAVSRVCLEKPSLLDGHHLPGSYGSLDPNDRPALNIDDFSFYSRVSNFFGPQTWAWTFSGKLNIILVMPDPRVRSVPNIDWWNLFNEMVVKMAIEGSSDVSA
ncbi:l- -diaminobutyrate decarboxylase [Fusarium acutatum]|uniref:L- -diaminobutyrate decarboxylase n=1 Tax=Fusarium acutatum TaxID=78861 RepID=A0A8H4JX64_9HYPO|nr:l- -diaminobutyrate decarboxylase [Fusarium acutatum]